MIKGGERRLNAAVASLPLPADGAAAAIADYGAGPGATSVHAMRTAITALRGDHPERAVLAIHSDLLDQRLHPALPQRRRRRRLSGPAGGPVYPAAVAGSFFDQVLPAGSVDLGICSNASHWLREQPTARISGGMYFSDATGDARVALADQAAADWEAFLVARAAELAPGGRLIVQGIGAKGDGEQVSASRLLHVMWQVADGLADEGSLDRGLLDAYVFPVYCRSAEEAAAPLQPAAPLAGVLAITSQEVDEVSSPYWEAYERDRDAEAYAESYVEFVRAFAETTLLDHLFTPGAKGGDPAALCDEYFNRLTTATARDPDAGRYEAWILRTIFEKRG